MGEQSISLSMPHIAEMTISAVINWEKIKRMEMKFTYYRISSLTCVGIPISKDASSAEKFC